MKSSPLEGPHVPEAAAGHVHAVEVPVPDDVVEAAGDQPGAGRFGGQGRHRLRAVLQGQVGRDGQPAARVLSIPRAGQCQ